MVSYLCDICKGKYDSLKKAEECESKGIAGPDFEPGLLLKNKNNFLLFYQKFNQNSHEWKYYFEEVNQNGTFILSEKNNFKISNKNLKDFLNNYVIATNNEIREFNQLAKKEYGRTPLMQQLKIEKLHNNFNLESYLSS